MANFFTELFFGIIVVLILWTVIRWVFGFGSRPMYTEKPKWTPARWIALAFVLLLIWGLVLLLILPALNQ